MGRVGKSVQVGWMRIFGSFLAVAAQFFEFGKTC